MKAEPLNINNKKFLINRLIQQAPTGTLIREFFKNADESAALAEEGNRRIEIYPVIMNGVNKLAFWNTGIGMDEKELKTATDISSSINKELALDGNFGIGAKVSGLTVSRDGIRYRSCKDGRVHEVTIGYDEEEGTYVRFAIEMPDGKFDTIPEITHLIEEEGIDTDYDWTEVVLYGECEDHDTVLEPLGKGKNLDRSYVPTTIFRRFAEFSEGVEVRIDVAMTKGGGKDETGKTRRLKTLRDVMDKLPRNETVSDESAGIAITYLHDPKHENSSHTLSARANSATASTTFCALVHKGERYDFKTKKTWSSAAPNFGIPFGSKVLTIEIAITNDLALPNQYRDGLTWPNDRSPMVAEDFNDYVRELMPDWVRDIIRSESPEASDNLDDLQTDLQKLLDEFRVPVAVRKLSRKHEAEPSEPHDEGDNTSDKTSIDDDNFPGGPPLDPEENPGGDRTIRRASKRKIRKAPKGYQASRSSKALEHVPEIKILTDKEEITEKLLQGRAGRYYKDGQTLFINGLYPVVNRMATELEREFVGTAEPEVVRKAVLDASRRFMAFRVGKTVCYAISKRLAEDWNMDDLDKATEPESLSMAADDYKQSLPSARKWVKEQLKVAQMDTATAAQ